MRFSTVQRLRYIVQVLFDLEMHHIIASLGLRAYLPFHRRFEYSDKKSDELSQPKTIRIIFEKLGGAFIKLGQILALRPDLVGYEFSKEFESLLSHVPPEDYAVIIQKVKHIPFTKIEKIPLGSASIAQVHKAVLGGKTVAVKIKKPGIDQMFEDDIYLMKFLANRIKKHFPEQLFDPLEVVEEFSRYTALELDFTHEAANLRRFKIHFKDEPSVIFPTVYEEYSTRDILVMEYIPGKLLSSSIQKSSGNAIVKIVTSSVYKMIFEDGFFHADLHPGNIIISNKKVAFLDCGIAGYIDERLEKDLFTLFVALVDGKIDDIADALIQIHIGDEEPDIRILKNGLYAVLSDYYDQPLGKMRFDKMFFGSIETARRAKLKLPPELVLFGKSLVTMEGFCRKIDPNFRVVENAKPYVISLVKKKINISVIARKTKKFGIQLFDIAEQVPGFIKSLVRKFSVLEMRVIDIDNTFRHLTNMVWKASSMLVSTILFSTFFIASIIMIDRSPQLFGISTFSFFSFIFSGLFLLHIIHLLSSERN